MHVISVRPFQEAAAKYPKQRAAIMDTYRILRRANFKSPDGMRKVFSCLDNFKYEDKWWVIDINGNSVRMVAFIQFAHNRIYIKHIFNHAEYDKFCEKYRKGFRK